MKQVFLLKPKVNKKPVGDVPLAEDYLTSIFDDPSDWLFEVIRRVFRILDHLTINNDGSIKELNTLYTYNGSQYLGIKDYFTYDPNNPSKRIPYTVLKKLNAGNNSYEIRFRGLFRGTLKEYRIVLTVHKKLNYLVLTHGFSKTESINYYYGIGDANEVTTQLGLVASDLYNIINDNINGCRNTKIYLGKEGEQHEVKF